MGAEVIAWCNTNIGFLTAVLSVLTLLVSLIAVGVSIHTARMPYKKKIKLSASINILVGREGFAGQVTTHVNGIEVSAVNLGNRNINLTFLGFAVRHRKEKLQVMQSMERNLGGNGILEPTKISSVEYNCYELNSFEQFSGNTRVYCYAKDSEGKIYKKYYGSVAQLLNSIQNL